MTFSTSNTTIRIIFRKNHESHIPNNDQRYPHGKVAPMKHTAYSLFGIESNASPCDILKECKSKCAEWTFENVTESLKKSMPIEQAMVHSKKIYDNGNFYMKSSASILLDPSARQCYDAWLDVLNNPTPEKKALVKARILWFNEQKNVVKFSDKMIEQLGNDMTCIKPTKKRKGPTTTSLRPKCRTCRNDFDFDKPYLVLHCHCTTRVGHIDCLTEFNNRVNKKCPVCRQQLLMRHQVSKYLFWNVREKFKFVV
jgi:hypothetical protein